MGCVKSKRSAAREGQPAGEKAQLAGGSAPVSAALLDYAQRLSEDIVARAVQQWLELDSRYSDIPYIECDAP